MMNHNERISWAAKRSGYWRPLAICGLILFGVSGCSGLVPESSEFGVVNGSSADRSVNGLGVHRRMWEAAGAKCLTPQKLSPKLDSMDVIVLVGRSYGPPGKTARDWLEEWLGKERGRTLIYFGRDFDAGLYYRQQTLDSLDADDRSRGDYLVGADKARVMRERLGEIEENTFCRWFYMEVDQPIVEHAKFEGPWANDLQGSKGSWPVGIRLLPPDRTLRTRRPQWLTKNNTNTLQPPSAWEEDDSEGLVTRSVWSFDEIEGVDDWNSEFRKAGRIETLLYGEQKQALVFRLQDSDYRGSQILVLANGAPLLNGSLVQPLQRVVGEKLIEECLPAERVALIAYDSSGLLMSTAPEVDNRLAGLEMLTVWPMSAITVPAALLGILVCAVLFPILGRPQQLPGRSVTDFGLHVDALGRMLAEAQDEAHARKAIADYFEKVRRESPPAWLYSLPGSAPQSAIAGTFAAAPRRSDGSGKGSLSPESLLDINQEPRQDAQGPVQSGAESPQPPEGSNRPNQSS